MPSDRLSHSQSFSYGTSKSVSFSNSGSSPANAANSTAYKLQLYQKPTAKDEKIEKPERKSSLKKLHADGSSASTSSFAWLEKPAKSSFKDSFANLNDYKLNRYKTTLMNENVNKLKFPSVEKNNAAFQLIRNHLSDKHREALHRPSFNAAGIRPVENRVLFARELTIHRLDANANANREPPVKSNLKANSLTKLGSLNSSENKATADHSYNHFHSSLSTPTATRISMGTAESALRPTAASSSNTRTTFASSLKTPTNKQHTPSADLAPKTKRVTLQLFDDKPSSMGLSNDSNTIKDELFSSDTERTISTPVSKSTACTAMSGVESHHHQQLDLALPKLIRSNTLYHSSSNSKQHRIRFSLANDSEMLLKNSFDEDKMSEQAYASLMSKTPANSRLRAAAPVYRNIPSLLPKIEREYTSSAAEYDIQRLQQNYKQSGANIRDIEQQSRVSTYGRNFKVNVGAPKVWLKSKYLPNAKLDTSFLSSPSTSGKVTYLVSN